jgi:Domain of unknown function (DUF5666)
MRTIVVALAAASLLMAQKPLAPLFQVLIGRLTAVSGDRIEVQDSAGTHVLYSDAASDIWRGKDYHDFSVLQLGDEVDIRYRNDAQSRAVVINLWANIDKVEGRIRRVDRDGFQVDENYSADPDSGYRRGLREILYDSGTRWEGSLAEDLKIGRDVFVIGLKLPSGKLEATRVIVYEGHAPVRMKPSRIMPPGGAAH